MRLVSGVRWLSQRRQKGGNPMQRVRGRRGKDDIEYRLAGYTCWGD